MRSDRCGRVRSILGALGAIFFAIGAGIILFAVYQARKAADLMKNGKRCLTTVQRVELNEHLRVNGKNPYQVLTQWQNPATGQTRIFQQQQRLVRSFRVSQWPQRDGVRRTR